MVRGAAALQETPVRHSREICHPLWALGHHTSTLIGREILVSFRGERIETLVDGSGVGEIKG